MDRAESHSKLPTPLFEVEDYYSSDLASLRQAFHSETEAKSSKTIVMPVIIIGTNNLEEEMASMKAMLERLVKESEENEACLKLQEEKITRVIKKLEKQQVRSFTKG